MLTTNTTATISCHIIIARIFISMTTLSHSVVVLTLVYTSIYSLKLVFFKYEVNNLRIEHFVKTYL